MYFKVYDYGRQLGIYKLPQIFRKANDTLRETGAEECAGITGRAYRGRYTLSRSEAIQTRGLGFVTEHLNQRYDLGGSGSQWKNQEREAEGCAKSR